MLTLATDVPFLPALGDLYLINTLILWGGDRKRFRPVVVVDVPRDVLGRIAVVTRTTKKPKSGVAHKADLRLRLDRDGMFARTSTVEAADWMLRNVEHLGPLDRSIFEQIQEWLG